MRRTRIARGVLAATALSGLIAVTCLSMPATAITQGKSYLTLKAGFTQELISSGPISNVTGAAFAPDHDVWFTDCGGGHIYRIDLQTPAAPVHGSNLFTVGPAVAIPDGNGCGLVNHPNGSLYTNASAGVVRLNANTGAEIGTAYGPAGNELGIATDPVTKNLVYVGSDGSIHWVSPDFTSNGVFSAGPYNDVDGIYFDPTGTYLFMSERSDDHVVIVKRNGSVLQSVPVGAPLDGMAFHAENPQFVLTMNTDGTVSQLSFPGNDYSKTPTITQFASGGFYGDIANVGPDGCLYASQYGGTRYQDGTTSSLGSIVRICGGFAAPIGVATTTTTAAPTTTEATTTTTAGAPAPVSVAPAFTG
jgi:hypothetical protein